MFILQWAGSQTGCPHCSHRYVEVHEVRADNEWSGKCPNCGTQIFGALTLTASRSRPPGDRLCRITKPFFAVRYHDEAAIRQFCIGEKVRFEPDQSGSTVVFNIDDDPWIVRREILLPSIEVQG